LIWPPLLISKILRDLLDPVDKKQPLRIALPSQHAQRLSIVQQILILGLGVEVFHEVAGCRPDALTFIFPKPDLVHHSGWQDGIVFLHLRVRVCCQVIDNL